MSAPLVVITEPLAEEATDWLARRCTIARAPAGSPELDRVLPDAAGLVVRTYTIVDEALLDKAKALRVVGRAGVGLDNIDVAACRRRGIEVVYTPDANTQAVVEYVVCLLGDALRPRVVLSTAVDDDEWSWLRRRIVARQMDTLTLGILGLGRIGRRVAEVATAIGFRTIYNDLVEIPADRRGGAGCVPLETLLEESDVMSVHVDGRPSNRHYLNADRLDRLRPEVVLVNTSRGMVVDAAALAAFLRAHPQATAWLDVHEPEPIAPEYPLLGLPNAKLLPHLAARTHTAMENMSWVVRDVAAVLEGRAPACPAPGT